jgi:hypothetical protein
MRRLRATSAVAFAAVGVLLAACAAPRNPADTPLGDRVRVRIASRGDINSITTARYWLLLQVRGPRDRVESFGVNAPEASESESIGGSFAVKLESVLDLPDLADVESLHGDPELCHDFVLTPGWSLDFTPGRFYAYRVAGPDGRMVADLDPEIRIGQSTADGSRYVELQPTAGPDRRGAEFPPGWPPGR